MRNSPAYSRKKFSGIKMEAEMTKDTNSNFPKNSVNSILSTVKLIIEIKR
jgi:hypothetical protein